MIEAFLAAAIFLGGIFRLIRLTTLPAGLFGDEVDVGYQAWSLISTGRDYMGHFLPTYIQSLAEWRAPLLMYLTAPFVGFFGPTPLAVRLPVALVGTASIYLIYLLVKEITKSKTTALLSAIILAFTPWHIHYSRAAFEVVPLIFLVLLGTYLFLKGKTFLSLIPFFLTFYTYSTAVVFTPLFLAALWLIQKPKINFRQQWPSAILPLIIILPAISNILFGQAGGRFGLVSIFSDPKISESVILQRTAPWVKNSPVEVLFHNKFFGYAASFFNNYLTAFSPQFLFLNGDPFFRHSVSLMGEMLWVILPLFLAGLFFITKNWSQKNYRLVFFWLLISPIASSLTVKGGEHATRLFLMIPPLIIISAIGLEKFFSDFVIPGLTRNPLNKFLKIVIFTSLFAFSFANFYHRYSAHYRYESASMWNYGYENIFKKLKPLLTQYDKVYINNSYQPSLLMFLFYTGYPPVDFQRNFVTDKMGSFQTDEFYGFIFDSKYYFGEARNLDKLKMLLTDKDIYLAAQGKEGQGDWNWSKTPLENTQVLSVEQDFLRNPLFYLLAGTRPYNE